METIKRHVRKLSNDERRLYEQTIGHALSENQQIIIQIMTVDASSGPFESEPGSSSSGTLPPWCNVYEGLSEEEIDDLDQSIIRNSSNRFFD